MVLRTARHTNRLTELIEFYTAILGLEILYRFDGTSGYDGVILGQEGSGWQVEFTQSADAAEHAFDEEDLLVFYPTERAEYDTIMAKIAASRLPRLKARNSYWDDHGIMVQDPDGFRVVVSDYRLT